MLIWGPPSSWDLVVFTWTFFLFVGIFHLFRLANWVALLHTASSARPIFARVRKTLVVCDFCNQWYFCCYKKFSTQRWKLVSRDNFREWPPQKSTVFCRKLSEFRLVVRWVFTSLLPVKILATFFIGLLFVIASALMQEIVTHKAFFVVDKFFWKGREPKPTRPQLLF